MSDEVTTGFTTIEEDNSTTEDAEKHLEIEIADYLGDGSNLKTYLNLGAWAPVAAAKTTVGGALADPFVSDGQPDPAGGFTRDESGDDMLAPFLYDLFLDDTRERSDGSDADEANVALSAVSFARHAKPPGLDDVKAPEHVTHGGDDPFYLSPPLRAAVTKAIPTFVGWRDHTEGHRITTTRGDKVEVIGGNYKLFVLGRGSGTVATDWSGGHVVDKMEAPGLVTSINWRKVPTGETADERGWQWVEETVKGNIIQRFHGTHKTEHYGDEIIEIIGRSEENEPLGVSAPEELGDFDDVAVDAEEDNLWDGARPTQRTRPRIIHKAWVTSEHDEMLVDDSGIDIDIAPVIDSYLGCKPLFDERGEVATLGGGSSNAPDGVGPNVALESSDPDSGADVIRETVVADNHAEIVFASAIFDDLKADEFRSEYTGASNMLRAHEYWRGVFFEKFDGNNTQMFVGAFTTWGFALRLEMYLGAEIAMSLGPSVDLSLGIRGDLGFTKQIRRLFHSEAKASEIETAIADVNTRLAKIEAGVSASHLSFYRNLTPMGGGPEGA